MKILITGICGYVGSHVAKKLVEEKDGLEVIGIDNLSRSGVETNLPYLKHLGIKVFRGDLRLATDVQALPKTDWVIDCAANPSVLAGIVNSSGCTPAQLIEHNLGGTLQLLEYCRVHSAGLILLSTSRVYSVDALCRLSLQEGETRFDIDNQVAAPTGFSQHGVSEAFPTDAPISLYGATKLASETLALEYGNAFGFPVWINRCGVIGGTGQFGKIDQGIFSFWVYSCALSRPLSYIGFGGTGKQVRDCVTAEDVATLIIRQINNPNQKVRKILNVGGSQRGSLSLVELTRICEMYFERRIDVSSQSETRPYDIPYYVTDVRRAKIDWDWEPTKTAHQIAEDLCVWTTQNMDFVRGLFI